MEQQQTTPQKKPLKEMTPEERTAYNRDVALRSYYKNRDKILQKKREADVERRNNGYFDRYYENNRQKILENQRVYDTKKREEKLKLKYLQVLNKVESIKTES